MDVDFASETCAIRVPDSLRRKVMHAGSDKPYLNGLAHALYFQGRGAIILGLNAVEARPPPS